MPVKSRAALLKSQLEDLTDPSPRDFDPEDAQEQYSEHDSHDSQNDRSEADEETAREHYAKVGKSHLRKPAEPALGPQYAGSRVDRNALMLDEDDEHDPFAAHSDAEETSESESRARVDLSSSADGSSLADDTDDTSQPSEDEDEGDYEDMQREQQTAAKAELKQVMAQERKTVAGTLSQAAKEDAEKGRAVKLQRTTFDALLNARIKLQKALVGSNTLSGLCYDSARTTGPENTPEVCEDAFQAAESAAFKFWQSLTDLRHTLNSSRDTSSSTKKRKHKAMSTDTPTSELLALMQEQETSSRPYRTSVLDKWSLRTRGAANLIPRNRMNQTEQTTLSQVLEDQLARSDGRLIARTRVPRSCAPHQLARQQSTAQQSRSAIDDQDSLSEQQDQEDIYDDTDFYGVLLSKLLEQKGNVMDTSSLMNSSEHASSHKLRRDAKTKRPVDNKASKGRRMKYNVHEKLQNFTAPEDRGSWDQGRVDELFGSLFGARMALREERQSENEEHSDDDDNATALDGEGLRLFR